MATIERLENISVESEGVARASFTSNGVNVPVGIHKLKGYYDENDTYNAAESELANFVVNNATTTTISNYIGNTGETISLVANVTSNSLPVNEGSVQFKVGGTIVGTTNVINGEATLTYTIACEDQSNLQAIYQGVEGKYAISTSELRIITVRGNSNIFIDNIIMRPTDSINASGTATYTNSNNETINITSGTGEFYIDDVKFSDITITNGAFTLTGYLPEITSGLKQCRVTLNETEDYEADEHNFTIFVKYRTALQGNPSSYFSATLGEPLELVLNVYSSTVDHGQYNTLVMEGTVVFEINGTTVRSNVVNGVARAVFDIPSELDEVLSYSAQYEENNNYLPSAVLTRNITIREDAFIEVEDITATVGDTVYLRAHITDENDDPVSEGTVDFEILEATSNP